MISNVRVQEWLVLVLHLCGPFSFARMYIYFLLLMLMVLKETRMNVEECWIHPDTDNVFRKESNGNEIGVKVIESWFYGDDGEWRRWCFLAGDQVMLIYWIVVICNLSRRLMGRERGRRESPVETEHMSLPWDWTGDVHITWLFPKHYLERIALQICWITPGYKTFIVIIILFSVLFFFIHFFFVLFHYFFSFSYYFSIVSSRRFKWGLKSFSKQLFEEFIWLYSSAYLYMHNVCVCVFALTSQVAEEGFHESFVGISKTNCVDICK